MKDYTNHTEFYQLKRAVDDLSELDNAEMNPLKAAWYKFRAAFP